MSVADLIKQKAFLGREFMTWLWFRSDEDPVIELPGGRRCEVEFLEQLALESVYGDAKSSVLKGESPATSPEAAVALREGKKVRRARIKFCRDGNDWIGVIDAETLSVSGLKMPAVGRLPFDEAIELRMEHFGEFETMFAELYHEFLDRRLEASTWDAELKTIRAWAGRKK